MQNHHILYYHAIIIAKISLFTKTFYIGGLRMKKTVLILICMIPFMVFMSFSVYAHHGHSRYQAKPQDTGCCYYYDDTGCGFKDCDCLCDACERCLDVNDFRNGFKPVNSYIDQDRDGIRDNYASGSCGTHHDSSHRRHPQYR